MRCPGCNIRLEAPATTTNCPECGISLAPVVREVGESFYRTVVETAEEGIWAIDGEAVTTFVNSKMAQILGYRVDEMLGKPLFDFMDDSAVVEAKEHLARRREGVREQHDFEFRRKDGQRVWVSISTGPLEDDEGDYAGAVALMTDVTAQRRIERQLENSEERLRQAIDAAGVGAWHLDIPTMKVHWSDSYHAMFGAEGSEASFDLWRTLVHPSDVQAVEKGVERALTKEGDYRIKYRLLRPDGSIRWVEDRARTVCRDGQPVAMYGVVIDLTEDRERAQTLSRRDAILEAVSVSARQLLRGPDWRLAIDDVLRRLGTATGVSRAYLFENSNRTDGTLVASQRAEFAAPGVAPEIDNPDLQNVPYDDAGFGRWRRLFEAGEPVFGRIYELPADERPLLDAQGVQAVVAVPVWVAGAWWGWLGFDDCEQARDWKPAEVEALSAAADAVAAAIERAQTAEALREGEEMLLVSQKLEAVGRLAGGVAHDFNNLLTAITGYGELIRDSLESDSPLRADCEELLSAASRAADLTRQLLAFGRRQQLEPARVDVEESIAGVLRLLERIIGEDIRIEATIEPGVEPLFIDPGQLEQVLVNLAVNARDAMPEGGRIDIIVRALEVTEDEPWRVPPGRYVEFAVADSGVGVAPEHRERIFEPFFSTKGAGGSGLGLATVYGIVEQSGGDIRVEGNQPHGTVFRLLLPPYHGDQEAPSAEETPQEAPGSGGLAGKRVMLVEDQPEVSNLLRMVLAQQGCLVTVATSLADAEEQLPSGPVDVLVSDVVLPDGSGRDLAQRLREAWPQLTVLLISGYDEDRAGLTASDVPADFGYLSKPFSPSALVRQLTDQLAPSG